MMKTFTVKAIFNCSVKVDEAIINLSDPHHGLKVTSNGANVASVKSE